MTAQFEQFREYRFTTTKISERYCEHVIACKSGERTERWTRSEFLGKGASGKVWMQQERGGALRAVKQMDKSKTRDLMTKRELLALSILKSHPEYFVQFFGWFEDDEHIYVAMEFVQHGNLHDLIAKNAMAECNAKSIARQLLSGLKVMHEKNIYHRDLKPQNILVASLTPIKVKICDFGVSKQVQSHTITRTMVGTLNYMAPEIWGNNSSESSVYAGAAADIWSLGCVIFTMLTKKSPFQRMEDLERYAQDRLAFPRKKLEGKSEDAVRFIVSLMKARPDRRPTAEQALGAPWLSIEKEVRGMDIWGNIWDEMASIDSTFSVPWPNIEEREEARLSYEMMRTASMSKKSWFNRERKREEADTWVGVSDQTTTIVSTPGGPRPSLEEEEDTWAKISKLSLASGGKKMKERDDTWAKMSKLSLLSSEGKKKEGDDTRAKMSKSSLPSVKERKNEEDDTWAGMSDSVTATGSDLGDGNAILLPPQHNCITLYCAIKHKNLNAARRLCARPVRVNAKQRGNTTLLHMCVTAGIVEIMKLLLDKGADTTAKNANEKTPFDLVVEDGHIGMLKLLLENGADIEAKNNAGDTALFVVVKKGHESVVVLLLENGVDKEAKNKAGDTILFVAVEEGRERMVELLLDNGVDVGAKNSTGDTALFVAARNGHEGVVGLLLEYGADIEEEEVHHGWTALHAAAYESHEGVVALLLENGADPDKEARDRETEGSGYTALHEAAYRGCEGVVMLLLENGADINKRTSDGQTVLHYAASGGRASITRLLLENEVDTKTEDNEGATALHEAARGGDESVVLLLLEHGADIKKTTKSGWTVLHYAASRGQVSVARLLLARGADVKVKDAMGLEAFHLASVEGYEDVARLLSKGEDEM